MDQNINSSISGVQIDIFSLKMLAILMCRDTIENKATLFVDTVIGRVNLDQNVTSIQAESIGLKRGIKLITWFSEVFPKQY